MSEDIYSPPTSVWKLVQTYTAEHEHEEIRNMLGESMVEQSIELQNEVEMLLDIWREYRENSDRRCTVTPPLPEPPEARERLCREIKFFVESIREKSRESGKDPEKIILTFNEKVLDYAFETNRPDSGCGTSRPSTARSRDGRETPLRRETPTSDRFSTMSSDLEAMNKKLNVLELDEVTENLRSAVTWEVDRLNQDVIFLQTCLDEESGFKAEPVQKEPTLTDLKEERNNLEKEFLSSDVALPQAVFRPTSGRSSLQSINKKQPIPPIAGPLKADHTLTAIRVKHKRLETDHVTVRVSRQPKSGSLHLEHVVPTPPTAPRPAAARPSSASRFRKMVLDTRDS